MGQGILSKKCKRQVKDEKRDRIDNWGEKRTPTTKANDAYVGGLSYQTHGFSRGVAPV